MLYWQCWRWNNFHPLNFHPLHTHYIRALLPPVRFSSIDVELFSGCKNTLSIKINLPSEKRDSFSGTRHQVPTDRQMMGSSLMVLVPCTVSDAHVVPTLNYTIGPGQGVSCWEIQASVRKELSRSADGTWNLAHPAAGPWGSTDVSLVYEPFQELCIHLAIDQLPGSWTLAGRPAPKDGLRLEAFKTFQALSNQYITTFIYHTHASLKGLLMEAFQIQASMWRTKTLVLCYSTLYYRRVAPLALPKSIQFASILDICT